MVLLLLYTLSVAGLSYWVGYAKLTEGVRQRLDAFLRAYLVEDHAQFIMCGLRCMACTSFWFGFAVGVLRGRALFLYWGLPHMTCIERTFILAFTACMTSFILGTITGLIKR